MIWAWLASLMYAVVRLLIPPPPATVDRIDPNAACPACGAKTGKLEFVRIGTQKDPRVMHTCGVCGFKWHSKPVSVPEDPAI